MSEEYIKQPPLDGLTPDKLNIVQEKYHSFKAELVSEEKELSIKQTEKLKDFINQVTQIKNKVAALREQCLQQNAKLGEQISSRQKKLEGFQEGAKNFQLEEGYRIKIAEEERKFVSNCQKRIQIADSINYQKLSAIQIDEKKSIANEVFKWILVSIYGEPENKYYWPNFKEQVLEDKQPIRDFKERLGKVSPYNAKEEQRVQTNTFIKAYEKVKEAPEFKKCRAEIDKIYEIAQIFLECCQIAKHVKNYKSSVEESRKQNSKEDEHLVQMRRQCDALVEKYNLGQLYLKQLTSIENSLTTKLNKYNEEVKQAETYTLDMQNMTVSRMTVALEPEKRDNCQCTIY